MPHPINRRQMPGWKQGRRPLPPSASRPGHGKPGPTPYGRRPASPQKPK